MFEAPIPGQSLTDTPKNYPWERPPEMVDPEEVAMMYLERLNGEETLEAILDALELDMDVKTLTEGVVRVGVAEGLHTIDVGLLVSPVLHEFIVTLADEAGIEYDEGLVNKRDKAKKAETITKAKRKKMLDKVVAERKANKGSRSEPEVDLEPMDMDDGMGEPELSIEESESVPFMTRRAK
jgi:archaellum component FlaD/FlaE